MRERVVLPGVRSNRVCVLRVLPTMEMLHEHDEHESETPSDSPA